MNPHQLKRLFPNASQSVIDANKSDYGKACYEDDNSGATAKLECHAGDEPLGKKEVQSKSATRFLVLVTSVRKRLLDEDNLCEKYHVDLCRYAGIIPSDAPEQTSIKTTQRKCEKGEEEHTEILIYES